MKRTPSIWSENHAKEYFRDEYPEFSMFSLLQETALKYPDYTALEFQNKKTTYSQMISQIELTAQALLSSGVKKGDFVSVITPNMPQALIMVYAINRIGAVANMIHPLLSATEIKDMIENVDSAAILTVDMIYPKFAQLEWKTSRKPVMILARITDALPFYAKPIYAAKNKLNLQFNPSHDIIYWNDFLKKGKARKEQLPPDDGKGDDLAVIHYSGGTSGTPKGVMLHNRAFNSMAVQCSEIKRADNVAGKKGLALMPTFHGFGLGICMHTMLYFGTHIILVPKFSTNDCAKLIFKKKINYIYAVPTLYEALSRTEEIEKEDLSFMDMVAVSGDVCSRELMNRMNRYLEKGGSKARMTEAYGQTESLSGFCINPFFAPRENSVGIPFPDMEMKIVKPGTQETLPPGEDGEICSTGPTQMKGYFKNEAETAKALQVHADGKTWLHTGDIGCMDEDGYFYFRQRYSRMIITSGFNVYPTQIEDVISKCNGVSMCCVVGVKDRIVGQRIAAVIQPTSMDIDLDALRKQIIKACEENVAAYAMPQEIIFRETLPTTALGKVSAKQLTEELNNKKKV